MARFLADEQFPARVSDRLRRLGHDVVPLRSFDSSKSGSGIPDETVLAIAMAEGRALLTLNRKHFQALHTSGQFGGHRGIVACVRDDSDPRAQAKRIDAVVKERRYLDGQFILVPGKGTRRQFKANKVARGRRR